MLRLWCEAGLSPAEWWRTAPREFNAVIKGRADRHNAALVCAFWTARWGREKDMTPPKEVMIDVDGTLRGPARHAMTPDEHIGALDAWVAVTAPPETKSPKKRRRRRQGVSSPASGALGGDNA